MVQLSHLYTTTGKTIALTIRNFVSKGPFEVMVYPVVMYGCESCTIKKAEGRRIDALNYGVEEDF